MKLALLQSRRALNPPPRFRHHQYRSILLFVVLVAIIADRESGSALHSQLLVVWLTYSISVIGFYWIFGVAGRFAFCQTLMMALGAYLSAYISRNGGPFWWSLLGAVLGVAIVAALIAFLLRKTQAFYFGIATLALTEVGLVVFTNWTSFTGPTGTVVGVSPITLFGKAIYSNRGLVWFFLAALAVVLVLNAWLERSPLYREAVAARELEMVARTSGIRVTSVQVVMFSIGSAAGGLAGALLTHFNGFVGTDSFGLDLSIGIFLMLILGGSNSVWGPIIGAAVYVWLPQLLTGYEQYQTIIYGTILLVTIILMPEGLVRIWETVLGWLRWRRRGAGAKATTRREAPAAPPAVEAASTAGVAGVAEVADARPAPVVPVVTDEVLLEASDIAVHFSGVRAVDGVSLALHRGEILGVIGPNGSGKSTLLNALTGVVPATGRLTVAGEPVSLERPRASRDAGLARTFQSPQVVHPLSSLENVLLGSDDHVGRGLFGSWLLRPRMWRHERPRWQTAGDLLGDLGVRGALLTEGGELSYGEQRLVDVGRAVAGRPAVLMLDEPSAGLNDAETIELARLLRSFQAAGIALIVVDHKLGLIADICDRIVVIQLGKVIAVGTPEEVWRDPAVADAYLGTVGHA